MKPRQIPKKEEERQSNSMKEYDQYDEEDSNSNKSDSEEDSNNEDDADEDDSEGDGGGDDVGLPHERSANINIKDERKIDTSQRDIPLFQRLANVTKQTPKPISDSTSSVYKISNKKRKHEDLAVNYNDENEEYQSHSMAELKVKPSKRSKNAPLVMKSNRPVSRLRIDSAGAASNSNKYRDPRFSDISGKLNHDKFTQSYGFLEEYQENEVKRLEKAIKQTTRQEVVSHLKDDLNKAKQEMLERRRNTKLKAKLSVLKAEERDKVKQGIKKPFFLKRTAIKEIALEQKFEELKADGSLNKFLAKKRKKNTSKDRRALPYIKGSGGGRGGGGGQSRY